jgi:hypothetical protein
LSDSCLNTLCGTSVPIGVSGNPQAMLRPLDYATTTITGHSYTIAVGPRDARPKRKTDGCQILTVVKTYDNQFLYSRKMATIAVPLISPDHYSYLLSTDCKSII